MDSRLYLALARQLLAGVQAKTPITGGDDGPECRDAISRSYYSVYNFAVEYLDRIGFETVNTHACHQAVQFALNQSGHDTLRVVSTNLNTLHSERRRADYEMRNPHAERIPQAELVVKLAEAAIGRIESMLIDAGSMGQVAMAILNYINSSQTTAIRRKETRR